MCQVQPYPKSERPTSSDITGMEGLQSSSSPNTKLEI
jgi:hypothetical protein